MRGGSQRAAGRGHRRSTAVACAALLAASLACQRPAAGEFRDGCPGCTWQRLGLHPQAAAQSTATGRALMTLCPWRGRLYIGYGDYQANTGPTAVTAWDPTRGAFVTVHTSDTEAIYNFRPFGDALYAPATDRREHADYAVGEPWRDTQPVTSAHVYDMATLDGRDLGDHLVGQDAERVDITAAVEWLDHQLLGRHVVDGLISVRQSACRTR
ncbi:MAG TPA: hypothetical protein VF516_39295 [Kofleriaceae bacterium]